MKGSTCRVTRPLALLALAIAVLLVGAAPAAAAPVEDALFFTQPDGSLTLSPAGPPAGLAVTTGVPIVLHSNGSQAGTYPNGFKTVVNADFGGFFDAIVIAAVADNSAPASAKFDAVIKDGTTGQVIVSVSNISLDNIPLDFADPHCRASFGDPAYPAGVVFQITLAPPVNVVRVAPTDDLQLVLTPTAVFGSAIHLCVGDPQFTGMGLVVKRLATPITLAPATDSKTVGSSETLTATVQDDDGNPVNGAHVDFAVTSGPDAGTTGSNNTDSNGHATFTFTGSSPGTDTVQASFSDANGLHTSNASNITWLPEPTTLTYTGDTTADFHDPATLSAQLLDSSASPVAGQPVSFTMGAESCSGMTNASGVASCGIVVGEAAGPQTATASFAGTSSLRASSASSPFTVTPEEAALVLTGPGSADFHDPVTLTAVLLEDGLVPIAGRAVTFTLGTQSCGPVLTGATGSASCTIASIDQMPGTLALNASFAGDAFYEPASSASLFVVTREETTLSYTGPTAFANGGPVTLTSLLREDGTVPISGRAVTMTLGSGPTAQSCTGTSLADGSVSCTIATVSQPLGPGTVSATFAGDAFYLPSSASASTLVFAFPAGGVFVIGNLDDLGGPVTWWGAQWWKLNSLSGGAAPSSFKGFAPTTQTPACGLGWSSAPGASSAPPSTVPLFMGVVVASTVTQGGSAISGNTVRIVVVRTDAGYGPDPGATGTGVVVGVACG